MNRVHHPERLLSGPRPVAAALATLVLPAVSIAAEGGIELLPQIPSAAIAEALGAPPGFLLLAMVVFFVLLIAPTNQLLFKPLLKVLDEREEKITGTRARAEQLESEAEEILARYESSVRETREQAESERRGLLEEVRGEAQRETAAARGEAETRIEQARAEIAASVDGARGSLRAQAQELAGQAASQVLGRAL